MNSRRALGAMVVPLVDPFTVRRPLGDLDSVVAVGVDAFTTILRLDSMGCGLKLESCGAVRAHMNPMNPNPFKP